MTDTFAPVALTAKSYLLANGLRWEQARLVSQAAVVSDYRLARPMIGFGNSLIVVRRLVSVAILASPRLGRLQNAFAAHA